MPYAEIHNDERKETTVAVLKRATAWIAARSVKRERVLSVNGNCYNSKPWKQTCNGTHRRLAAVATHF